MEIVRDEGRWSLLLQPDGVVVTVCWVIRVADGFELFVPRALGEPALARLVRFRLRVQCTITLGEADDGPFALTAELVEAGWPGAGEFEAGLVPHAFGRSFVDATVSFTKGCFTGQELVGRLDARGANVPWRLVRARGSRLERVETVLRSKGPEGPQGVTTVVAREGGVSVLGFAHRSLLGTALQVVVDDVAVELL